MVKIKGTHEEVDAVIALLQSSDCSGSDKVNCSNCPMQENCTDINNAIIVYTD